MHSLLHSVELLNRISEEKLKLLHTVFAGHRCNGPALACAVEEMYIRAQVPPPVSIHIAQGPHEAAQVVGAIGNSNHVPAENLAGKFLARNINFAKGLGERFEQLLHEDDLRSIRNVVFWDLNFQVSQRYVAPVLSQLADRGYLPDDYAQRPCSNPGAVDMDWLGLYSTASAVLCFSCDEVMPNVQFLQAGGFMLYAFGHCAVVCTAPVHISRDETFALHGDEGPAVAWADGTKLYFHHGVPIPDKLAERPLEVTREDVIAEENAEVMRCYQEILGSERFGELLGLVTIDAQVDRFGNDLILYRTKDRDKFAGNYIYFAKVVCPSTNRGYFLCVPPHIRSAPEAVAWSFGKSASDYHPNIET